MVRWEEERKKHTTAETMMEIKPADYSLKVMKEYVMDIVWVSKDIDAIKVKLL